LSAVCSTRSRALLRASSLRVAWSPLLNSIESATQSDSLAPSAQRDREHCLERSEWLSPLCSTRSRALLRAIAWRRLLNAIESATQDTKTLFKAKDSRLRDRHRADCFIVANSFALIKGRALFEAS
ncbi:hypothetical protein BT67DRAFT_444808, partial [Trichocladium antarcticum]